MGRVDGKVAIVTGGALGIGEAHARLLAQEGAHVVICDILDEPGQALAKEIGAVFMHLDVSQEEQWAQAVSAIEQSSGPIDILVNNAGIAAMTPVATASTQDWDRVIAVNLTGTFFGIRAVAASMKRAGGGVIVNTSSVAGLVGNRNLSAYVASKWGVRGLTKSAAIDLGPDNIRVFSLHPGAIETPMTAGRGGGRSIEAQPIPRVGMPEEVARMMLFLVTDATYSTGNEFIVDGGFTIK